MYSEEQQVYWYSGLYLQPQHFQSIDLHHSHMLARQRQLSQPWNTGIVSVDIHHETLADFVLKIDNLRAILPSGHYLEYPGNCRVEPYSFRDTWKVREKPFMLWLALRRFDPTQANVANDMASHAHSRWIISNNDEVMKDVYHHGPDSKISRLVYHVRILCEDEKTNAGDCEFLPLLRLCQDNDRVILDPAFSPPVVTLGGFPTLKRMLEGLFAELASRAHRLEEYKQAERRSAGGRSDNLVPLLVMHSLNRVLPLYNHYCKTPALHPWHMYGLLTQLVGELSSFNDICSFTGEPTLLPYDHSRLMDCFNSAKKTLITQLNGLVLENNTYISLHPDVQGIFHADITALLTRPSQSVLLLLNSNTQGTSSSWITDTSAFKIAPRHNIGGLIQHALPGITVTMMTTPPRGVPNPKNVIYFQLNQNELLWNSVEQYQNIAFYWAEAPDDLQVQLVFMAPSS
ncbi:type VI secretion system baseplate subunit TssK [Serratia sp. JSRIV001]|nr:MULTISPECIES: type VI secretion system baseplate subunit TssK [unclassified Serratia (in: enterobacteria)]UAN45158.1 type VI secretion system baseplate subunit TssK [Serratia sp. JSRIV001]UAN50665.1 type VI secretion system baseplate subunit TssK [Serratia sp. JSRIV002]UAN56622.1 type VI secretion system baseplate subunit TssK [Serratia sp. JSRIV004]UAN62229.1 type VI secretion system baseplate subunit TssK [Serratia sp. JSRIV006]